MNKNKSIPTIILMFLSVQLFQSCYYDVEEKLYHLKPVDCSIVSAKFSADVAPIISNNCATTSCHNSTAVGGVVLQTYDQIKSKVDRINQRVLIDKTMPPNGQLTASELAIIQCWISSGAPNN